MGRDSRSLSRKRRHSERHDRHRSRSIRRQSRRMSDRSHRNRSPSQDRQDIPSTWKSSSSHYDVNQVYGLSLPRTVESTQWSRKANLVGVPVDQVKVVDVIPGGMSNWGLRLIGNGRYTAFELFRSRLEAMIASILTKSFCKLQSEIDIQKLVAHFNSSLEGKTESPSRRKWWRVR
jgi:hypothetical protein